MPQSKIKSHSKSKISKIDSNRFLKQKKDHEREQNTSEINLLTLQVKLCDIFTCTDNNCNMCEFVNYLTPNLKKQMDTVVKNSKCNSLNVKVIPLQNLYQTQNLQIQLCDIFTCSEKNCFSYDVIKFLKAHHLRNKLNNLNKKLVQNVCRIRNVEVHLCDILTCSGKNCFSLDVTKYIKTCQLQLPKSVKPKKMHKKFYLSNFIENKTPKDFNKTIERGHRTSIKAKKAQHSETHLELDSNSDMGIEALLESERNRSYLDSFQDEIENDYYEPTSDETEEEEESEESDHESITETETETETESNSDPESIYGYVKDYEYIPRFEEAEYILESYSESETETKDFSYSESEKETEDFSYSESEKETESNSCSGSDTENKDESSSESDAEKEDQPGPIKRSQRLNTDRKRKRSNERIMQKKKFRKWRLRSLMDN